MAEIPSFNQLVKDLRQGITEEIECIKKHGETRSIEVSNGKLASSSQISGVIYIFEINASIPLQIEDSDITLLVGDKYLKGTIVRFSGNEIEIKIEKNLGPIIPKARISIEPTWLLEKLSNRLSELESGTITFNKDFALGTFFPSKQTPKDQQYIKRLSCSDLTPLEGDKPPREDQINALQHCLSKDVSFIWGPPGTGKTTTLVWLIESFLKQAKKILVVSHLNVAVDNAAIKIAQLLYNNQYVKDKKVLRFRHLNEKTKQNNNDAKYIPMVDADQICAERQNAFREEILIWQSRINDEEKQLKFVEYYIGIHDAIKKAKQELNQLEYSIKAKINEYYNSEKDVLILSDTISKVMRDLDIALNSNALKKFFLGLNADKLTRKKTELDSLLKNKQELLRVLRVYIATASEQKKEIIKKITEWQSELKESTIIRETNVGLEFGELIRMRDEINNRLCEYKSKIEELNKKIDDIEREVLVEARVILTTLSQAFLNDKIYSMQYDAVILDEASIAPLPAVFFTAGLAKEKFVVIGDFCQLGPICIAEQESEHDKYSKAKYWLGRDIYEQAEVIDCDLNLKSKERIVALTKQNRMVSPISSIVKEFIYKAKGLPLEDADDKIITDANKYKERITLYDTSPWNPWCSHTPTFSRINLRQALLTLEIAKSLIKGRRKSSVSVSYERRKVQKRQILVLTPYRGQEKLLETICANDPELKNSLRVSNIYQIQGEECNRIIIDLVDSNPMPSVGILFKSKKGLRLINVAFSRAKGDVIVVGNCDYFIKKSSARNPLKIAEIICYIQEKHTVQKVTESIAGLDAQKIIEADELLHPIRVDYLPAKMEILNENTFYNPLRSDIINAKKEIIICSPFLTIKRVSELIDLLYGKVKEGISVGLLSAPQRRQSKLPFDDNEMVIKGLIDAGVKVRTRYQPRVHEKIITFDRMIVYDGSLNAMSFGGHTTESMIRIEDSNITNEFMKLHGLNNFFEDAHQEERKKTIQKRLQDRNIEICKKCGGKTKIIHMSTWPGNFAYICAVPNERHMFKYVPCAELMQVLEEKEKICPKCNKPIICKTIQKGKPLLVCSGYPECKFALNL